MNLERIKPEESPQRNPKNLRLFSECPGVEHSKYTGRGISPATHKVDDECPFGTP